VLYTSGLAILILACLIYVVEVRQVRGWWIRFFEVFGKNPLFIFALSGLIPKVLAIIRIGNGTDEAGNPTYISPWGWFYQNVTAHTPGPPENGSLVFAFCFILLLWLIGFYMDKRKIYVRV
jgi:predicted acyltransferase